jgi:hypothetical protein
VTNIDDENVFAATDYKAFVRAKVARHEGERGYKGDLAKAAGCHRSFLSQALHGEVQLTPDHAAGMCRFWRLGADETDYFLCLVHRARASSPELRSFLDGRMTELKRRQTDVASRLPEHRAVDADQAALYYAAWHWSAVHMLLTIPAYRTAPAIASRLRLPLATVQATLAGLERMGLARATGRAVGKVWTCTEASLHLPRESPFLPSSHNVWRQKLITHLQEGNLEGLHYTGVHTMSVDDARRVRELALDCIGKARAVIAPSPEEELVCFFCDVFTLPP